MIRQFDIHRTPKSRGSDAAPFLCVLQSHYLEAVDTVIVAPLIKASALATPSQVAVPVSIQGEDYLLDVALMANIQRRGLGPAVANLVAHEDDIRRALDRLFSGF